MLKAIRNLVDLANQITGTLPVSNGGTGATSLTSNRLIKGDGTAALSVSNLYDDGSNAGVASGAFVIDAGSLQIKEMGSVAIADALNDDLVIPVAAGFIVFTGGGASAQLGGMVAGVDGQRIVILNTTGSAIPIVGESPTSTAANRIWTQGLATASWNNLGTREFVYRASGGQLRWLMIGSVSN